MFRQNLGRGRALAAGAALVGALVVQAPLSAAPTNALGVSVLTANQAESMVAMVNASRLQNGLGPLKLNSAMNLVALTWAQQMAANGSMTHNPAYSAQIPGGWTKAAENVAQGYPTPESMHDGWMGSTGHRANILGDFTDVGIAFITVGGTTWGVQNFAKYGASVAPPAPAPAPAPAPGPSADPAPTQMPGPKPTPSFTPIPSPSAVPTPDGESTPGATPNPEITAQPDPSGFATGSGVGPWIVVGVVALATAWVTWFVVRNRGGRFSRGGGAHSK